VTIFTATNEKFLQRAVTVLIFLLPIVMGIVPKAASAINILLLLLASFTAWDQWRQLTRQERVLCYAMGVFFLAALLSFINSEDLSKSWSRLDRLLRVLAFIPIFLLFKKIQLDLVKPLTAGMIVAGPCFLAVALLTIDHGRSVGAYNAILFGDYAALVTVYLLAYVCLKPSTWYWKVTALLALFCAAEALILSSTRGAWAAVLFAIIVIISGFLIQLGRKRFSFREAGIVVACTLPMIIFFSQNQALNHRSTSGLNEFVAYWNGSNPHTSLGNRFQMWEAGVKMWQKNPIIGTGLGDFSQDLRKMMQTGESQLREHFGEAHNLFVEFLATTGALGLVTCFFALFALPLWVFFKVHTGERRDLFITMCGSFIVVTFLIYGLSQNWLARSSISSTYFILLAVFLSSRAVSTNRYRATSEGKDSGNTE
jgi:O-antigen ligase